MKLFYPRLECGMALLTILGLALTFSPRRASSELNPTRLPLYFIENRGQLDQQVAYYIQGSDKTIYFAEDGVTFAFVSAPSSARPVRQASLQPAGPSPGDRRWALKLDFVGANAGVRPLGVDQTPAVFSYFTGAPEDWHTALPTFSSIIYDDLWPGVDLLYSGTVNQLKYTFVVQPGSDPRRIQFAYRGANSVRLTADGELEVSTPLGGFRDQRPYAYQEIGGQKVEVSAAYSLQAASAAFEYGFEVGSYDSHLPLLIDPGVLVYSGFVGGSGGDAAFGVAVDSYGNAYLTGFVTSGTGFPTFVGPDASYNGGGTDAFVAKVNPSGTSLVYAGFIGGSGNDAGFAIAVSSAPEAYVTGYTDSINFPAIQAYDSSYNGNLEAFVAKVSVSGTALVYSTYLGGSSLDQGLGIAVDTAGHAFVTGQTWSADFPFAVGPDSVRGGSQDAFVTKLATSGSSLVFSGFVGGSEGEEGHAIAIDSSANVYIGGQTYSSDFPAVGPLDATYGGGGDGFLYKLNSGGTAILYSAYIGGSALDKVHGVAVAGASNVYLTGETQSAGFPVMGGPDTGYNGGVDAFVTKVNSSGTALVYSGFIGGAITDVGNGIAVDAYGNAYVAGYTNSTQATFPAAGGPDSTFNGGSDGFIARVAASGSGLNYCSYLGGSGSDYARGVATDSASSAYVAGSTPGMGFPVLTGPYTSYNGGANDAFITKIRWRPLP